MKMKMPKKCTVGRRLDPAGVFWNLEEEVPAAGRGKHTKGKSTNRQKPKIRK